MKDERYKQLMEDVGMPNSRSLLTALKQAVNETAQQVGEKLAKQQESIDHLEVICREMLNDYINFDDGRLTESIFERASAVLKMSE